MKGAPAGRCIICGKAAQMLVYNPRYPEKKLCVNCLNGIVFNVMTVEEELEPIARLMGDSLDEFQKKK